MCGRFTFSASATDLIQQFDLAGLPSWMPRYHIVPTQEVLAVTERPDSLDRHPVCSAGVLAAERENRWDLPVSYAGIPSSADAMCGLIRAFRILRGCNRCFAHSRPQRRWGHSRSASGE
jgi:hypothetical protein